MSCRDLCATCRTVSVSDVSRPSNYYSADHKARPNISVTLTTHSGSFPALYSSINPTGHGLPRYPKKHQADKILSVTHQWLRISSILGGRKSRSSDGVAFLLRDTEPRPYGPPAAAPAACVQPPPSMPGSSRRSFHSGRDQQPWVALLPTPESAPDSVQPTGGVPMVDS